MFNFIILAVSDSAMSISVHVIEQELTDNIGTSKGIGEMNADHFIVGVFTK